MASSTRPASSDKIPLEDFLCEEQPFELPGGPALLDKAQRSTDLVCIGQSPQGSKLWLARRGALGGLLRLNLMAADEGGFFLDPGSFGRRAGWRFAVQPGAVPRILSWGRQASLLSQTSDRRRLVLILGAFVRQVADMAPNGHFRHLLAEACADLAGTDLAPPEGADGALKQAFGQLNERDRRIVTLRAGLDGKALTLEEVGRKLSVSRERIRQIESRVCKKPFWLTAFAHLLAADFIAHKGSRSATVADPRRRLWRMAHFVLGIRTAEFGPERFGVIGISEEQFDAADWREWGFDELFEGRARLRLDRLDTGLPEEDLATVAEALCAVRRRSMNKNDQIICALERIGRPAHYSDVATVCAELFPHQEVIEHNVFATLQRSDDAVYAGRKGVYGLKRWGVQAPSDNLDVQVLEILSRLHKVIGPAIPFNVVLAHVRRERPGANETSVQMILAFNAEKLEDGRWALRGRKAAGSGASNPPRVHASRFFRKPTTSRKKS